MAVDRLPIETALNAFTPVDHSVYASLDPAARQRHAADLSKRLSVAAELSAEGGALLVVDGLRTLHGDALVEHLDAVVEYGRRPEQLTLEEREQASQSQIRDEILHFDRIMDLESLKDGRDLKHRRQFVWDVGPQAAAERLLTLTYERRILRGDEAPEWLNVGADQPGRITPLADDSAVLVRDAAPQLVAVAHGLTAEDSLHRLQTYCGKHPLGVAIGLVDYEMFLNGEAPVALVAASAADWFGDRKVKVWAAGQAVAFTASRDGYAQNVAEVTRLDADPLGRQNTRYGRFVTTLGPDERLILALTDRCSTAVELSAALSRPNRKGRIQLNDNLALLFPDRRFVAFKPSTATKADNSEAEVIRDYVAKAIGEHPGPVEISMEVGHVHADRDIGPIQERGLDFGSSVIREIEAMNAARDAADRVSVEIVPMIDDDHVVNRLSYSGYQRVLADRGVPAVEIVLESSPVILHIACDLLQAAAARDGVGYTLVNRGDNLYLESNMLRIELVESAGDELHIGCIVYDTALTIYRTARAEMLELFRSRTGYQGDVHRDMLTHYDSVSSPDERERFRQQLDRLWKRPLNEILTDDATPYLDAYRDLQAKRAANGVCTIVLNVLEDYYEPLELKVKQFARLLGIDIRLDCLLFSPYGASLRSLHA